ncbi:MAG: ATPase, T2SS/T4P/T4SS family [Arenicellales bacterium]|jgi:type II secretory ATPase GspE/PulE/Tfp pilus assembly ATPase PilB-like protein|nr:ATPase, T2SS/T4P/T4SS family [Gammaproteobacteria bacterium]MDP7451647.1 ATPase, T2SS/T4P/T4SS family [Arenicellales bacterium]MDP7616239.1 ATPase, T2SS/T4P/T4SS family [Arenicellales bacterium]
MSQVTRGVTETQDARQLRRRLRLGEVLVSEGLTSEAEIHVALSQQKQQKGKRLGEVLVELGMVDESAIARVLANRLGLPFIDLDSTDIESDALAEIPARVIREQQVFPIRADIETLTVAMGDPLSTEAIDAVRFTCKKRVVEVVATPTQLKTYIADRLSTQESSEDFETYLHSLGSSGADGDAEDDDDVIKLVNRFIVDAVRDRASDIHIEPYGEKQDLTVRFRVDGQLRNYRRIPSEYRERIVARMKIMARLNIAERRLPQDGKIRFKLGEREIELRMVTVPTAGEDEDVVLRILAGSGALPLSEMGLSPENLQAVEALVRRPYGLMLAVGPTGSGKTTTLHSMLAQINDVKKKIWTVEDPVEITQPGLRQLQVQPQIGLTFASAMRSFLRADPDVIMVGEMRDEETAHMGIEASLTGHMVLSTLHTNTAPETVTRLIDMGMEPFSFSDALLGILSQRLARQLCGKCKVQYDATPDETDEFRRYIGVDAVERATTGGFLKLWRADGCVECEKTGYRGRLALHELLVNNDEIRAAIQRKATTGEIRDLAQQAGMQTLLQDGVAKCLQGHTDLKQVLAVCSR